MSVKTIFQPVQSTEHIARVERLAAEIWREHYITILSHEQIEYMLEKYQSASAITGQIHHEGYEYYLLEDRDAASFGYMAIQQEQDKLFLSKFYIRKEQRGQGYASQAIAFLEQLCRERSISRIWLTVNRHNEHSITVYKKKGFYITREQKAEIGNGFIMDDYVMEKDLSPL